MTMVMMMTMMMIMMMDLPDVIVAVVNNPKQFEGGEGYYCHDGQARQTTCPMTSTDISFETPAAPSLPKMWCFSLQLPHRKYAMFSTRPRIGTFTCRCHAGSALQSFFQAVVVLLVVLLLPRSKQN